MPLSRSNTATESHQGADCRVNVQPDVSLLPSTQETMFQSRTLAVPSSHAMESTSLGSSKTFCPLRGHFEVTEAIPKLVWNSTQYKGSNISSISTLDAQALRCRIEKTLNYLRVEFEVEEVAESYTCKAYRNCSTIKFSVEVVPFQEKSPRSMSYKHFVELTRMQCICPAVWQQFRVDFFAQMEDSDTAKMKWLRKHEEQKPLFPTLLQKHNSETLPKFSECECNWLLSSYIDATFGGELSPTRVQLTEVYADLSYKLSPWSLGKQLREGDISKLVSILSAGNLDVSRCTCVIVRNIANKGWLSCCLDEELDWLCCQILRTVSSLSSLSSDIGLQREVIKTLTVLSKVRKLTPTLKTRFGHLLQRLAASEHQPIVNLAASARSALN